MSQQKQTPDDKLGWPSAEAINKALEQKATKKQFLGNRHCGHRLDAGDKGRDSEHPEVPTYRAYNRQDKGGYEHQERSRGHTGAELSQPADIRLSGDLNDRSPPQRLAKDGHGGYHQRLIGQGELIANPRRKDNRGKHYNYET